MSREKQNKIKKIDKTIAKRDRNFSSGNPMGVLSLVRNEEKAK